MFQEPVFGKNEERRIAERTPSSGNKHHVAVTKIEERREAERTNERREAATKNEEPRTPRSGKRRTKNLEQRTRNAAKRIEHREAVMNSAQR